MVGPQKIAEDYMRLWNEADPSRRKGLLESGWTSDASYVDPLAKAAGREAIGALVGSVQQRFPGFTFALIGKADGYGDHVRFSWSLGPANGEAPIEGSDVLITKDERIAGVIGFLDKLPKQA